ncbi:hypothetical protein KRM28CT15_10700 [Krasilnikovia sp. M28-CT-15]
MELHQLHRDIGDAVSDWQTNKISSFPVGFGDQVRRRLDAINTSDIPVSGSAWREAAEQTRQKMYADFHLQ